MAIFDPEFGEIKVRRSKLARKSKIYVGVDGILRASIPYYSPEFSISRLIRHNREEIRRLMSEHAGRNLYRDGQQIGQNHWLVFRQRVDFSTEQKVKIDISANQIIVFAPEFDSIQTQTEIRKTISKILRKEAKTYLTRRVEAFAKNGGFVFEKLRFSHTATRWGSCSSRGTISLNIALMNLPLHLIDYVIIHELCHLRHMNHSPAFWAEVEKYCPDYKKCVQEMKQFSPMI